MSGKGRASPPASHQPSAVSHQSPASPRGRASPAPVCGRAPALSNFVGEGERRRPLGALAAQTRTELRLTLRRGESVLVTLVIPALLLVFFVSAGTVPAGPVRPVDWLLPGMLALAVMSTGLVSLGIATAYERYYRVLKRLGGTPLSRGELLAAKMLSVLAIEVVQIALLVAIAAFGYGWRPAGAFWAALPALVLGTVAFSGLGLLMAGTLRAEATLAGVNGLYLVLLLPGGMVLPLEQLPAGLAAPASVLPAAALSDTLRGALSAGGQVSAANLAVLAAWAVAATAAAARTFQWE